MKCIIAQKRYSAYLKLYHYFGDDIIHGVYSHKSKLPSKRITCAETGLSAITVKCTYDLLIQEGCIDPKEHSGYYVIFQPNIGFAFSKIR